MNSPPTRTSSLLSAAPIWLIAALLTALACAQGPEVPTSFDAASIKVNDSGSTAIGGFMGFRSGGRVIVNNATLRDLIKLAYALQDYGLQGGPGWLDTQRYDVEARPATAAAPVTTAQARLMLQNLLSERFKLRVHHESRIIQLFSLVAVSGVKRPESKTVTGGFFSRMGGGEIKGEGVSMTKLAFVLELIVHQPVVDNSHLTGLYDVSLQWVDDLSNSDTNGVSLFTALRNELGLKLEATKGPADVLVIDSADRTPTDN